jgi:hypothetical protein
MMDRSAATTKATSAVRPPGHRNLDRARFGEVRDLIHHHGGIATGSNAAVPLKRRTHRMQSFI